MRSTTSPVQYRYCGSIAEMLIVIHFSQKSEGMLYMYMLPGYAAVCLFPFVAGNFN